MRSLAVTGLAVLLAACQSTPDTPAPDTAHAGGHEAMGHGDDAAYSDLTFLDQMTAHHQMAVDLAALADSAQAGDDVRTLARTIAASQQAEIDSMAAWRARWFADAPAPAPLTDADHAAMGMDGMGAEAMGALRGAAFDRAFVDHMIPHHAGAIQMAAQAQAASERPEIRRLAAAIVDTQAREIVQMQAGRDAVR